MAFATITKSCLQWNLMESVSFAEVIDKVCKRHFTTKHYRNYITLCTSQKWAEGCCTVIPHYKNQGRTEQHQHLLADAGQMHTSIKVLNIFKGNDLVDQRRSTSTLTGRLGKTTQATNEKNVTSNWLENNPNLRVQKEEDLSDVFGTLDEDFFNQTEVEGDEGDREEEKYLSRRPNTRNTMWWYGLQLKKIIEQNQIGEALKFFKNMIEVDRVKPDSYVYRMLIGGCGRVGYTKMAFKLHRQMKDRGLKVPQPVYTSLFNACANSPWPEDGLRCANRLYDEVCKKNIILNSKNYHAAIKGFGRCKDLQMAMRLVDEMIQKKVGITTETFNFLLVSCASNTDGFLRALQVWRKLREKKIKPDVYSYNLLLRTVRDCNLGDPIEASTLLLGITEPKTTNENHSKTNSVIGEEKINETMQKLPVMVPVANLPTKLPDILSPKLQVDNVVSLTAANTAEDRLQMLGGWQGVLHRMQKDRAEPNLKTFTQLIEIIPSVDEDKLLEVMEANKIVPDVDFFNVLLKKRTCHRDFQGAKVVLDLIARRGLNVDIATFGALANGCYRWKDAEHLLIDMEKSGFRTNVKIMGALVKNACDSKDFWYLIDMMKKIKADNLKVDARILEDIEACIKKTKEYIVKQEKQQQESNILKLEKGFKAFLLYYKQWLKNNEIELPEHPWAAFRIHDNEDDDNDKVNT